MCNECTCQCANQKEKLVNMAKQFNHPKAVMNQATYEAISGDVLMIEGVPVEIDKLMPDRQYLMTGEYNATQ